MAEPRIDVSIEHKHKPEDSGDDSNHPNTCPGCGSHYRDDELAANLRVCPQCGYHFPVRARERIEQLVDKGPFREESASFMGGSMGSVVGEKLSRATESAVERKVPLVTVTASGGARMQEGILSLMQLPKTVCAIEDLRDARCGFISVMTHPTTAGVLASFASLGDVIVSEPGALLAFTGPRVVQQTTREKLPDDFGLAESNLRFGHLDAIVPRTDLRPYLGRALRLFNNGR